MSFKILMQISGDYPDICMAEIETLFTIYNLNWLEHQSWTGRKILEVNVADNVFEKKRIELLKRVCFRSACIKRCLLVLNEGSSLNEVFTREIKETIEEIDIIINRKWAIHVHRYSSDSWGENYNKAIDKIYDFLKEFELGSIDLVNPDVIFALYKLKEDKYSFGIEFHFDKKGFGNRRPSCRPVFTPFSLDPKLSRLLINLSGVHDNGFILDPFCGVAGIPIEAASIGIPSLCIELRYKWSKGAVKNLSYMFGDAFWEVLCGDSLNNFLNVKGDIYVATDPPYGRITSKSREISDLYEAFINTYVKNSEGSAFFSHIPLENLIEKYGLSTIYSFQIRVHKNLTRYLYVVR